VKSFLIISQTAFYSLRKEQKQMLEAYATLLPIAVPTVEEVEAGSVRCMMAEVFLREEITFGPGEVAIFRVT